MAKEEKPEAKLSVQQIVSIISVVAILVGGGVGWGVLQARVDALAKENTTLREDMIDIREELADVKEESVKKEDFRNIINEIKNDNQIIKNDIKKILKELSRGR